MPRMIDIMPNLEMNDEVVLGMKPKSKDDIDPFEEVMDNLKEKLN